MTMRGLAERIECPVLVCDAVNDGFFAGQPEQHMRALGVKATHRRLTEADAAGEHCHVGASDVMNGVAMDWLEETLGTGLVE